MNRNFKENTQAFAVKAALGYLEKDPEKNFPKLLAWGDKFDVSYGFAPAIAQDAA